MFDAVEHVLRHEGYAALSARRVAEVAGYNHQTVYYYFHTMEDLILAAFQRRAAMDVGGYRVAFDGQRRAGSFVTQSMLTVDGRVVG